MRSACAHCVRSAQRPWTLDPDPEQVRRVLRPGGVLVFDTINRSYQSYLLTIVLAQELHLQWLY